MAFANPQSQRASFSSISTPGWNYDVFLSFMGEDDCPSCAGWRPEAHVIEEITSTVWKSLNREFLHVEKNLVGMDRRRASSTCTSIGSWDYEAFLSLKGEDTRYNFTDHLYAALYQKGIRTFRLDEIRDSSEVDYIKDITHVIWMRFSHKLLHVDKNLIGMDYHLEEMEEIFPQMMDSISNDVRMVGIYGLRGIGKTTIAKVLYNLIVAQFMITTFIANRKNFISTVDERIHMIKDRLCFKKVLLVLDDVDDLNQLEALAGDHNWFGLGSRIIVTTRDKHLLEIVRQSESKLHKLEREPNQEIQCMLKRSYELDCTQQQIFLDVACFFNGEDKDSVTRILEACNFYAESGIRTWMHDLLQQMGQDIVGQEFPKEPGKWSRLCYPDVNLRLLKIYSDHEFASMGEHSKVKLSKDFEFPSYELRYLCWQGYPLESLPSSFYAEDLVELDMCYSSLKQLWESDMLLEKLNTIRLRLSCCQRLIEIPDISVSAPNLEKLTLDGCSSLVKVHPSIGKLSKLILLNLKNCKNLSSFPSIIDMEALEILNLSGCSELKKFPDIQGNMEHLLELYLASTAIKELPSSIEHLTGLVLLDLKRCKNLKSLPTSEMEDLKELLLDGTSIEGLPSSIDRLKGLVLLNLRNCKNLVSLPKGMCTLTSLETLIVSGCSQLNNLPKNLGSLQHLAQLHADGTAITQPPDSIVLLRNLKVLIYPGYLSRNDFLSTPAGISELTSLKDLRLGQYQSLTEIPKLRPSVRDIHPHNCTALLPGSSSVSTLEGLQVLFYNCSKSVEDQSCGDKRNELQRFPHNCVFHCFCFLGNYFTCFDAKLFENIAFSIVFPGSGIPEWIWHQNVGSSIKIELPTD
ncbi:hypothetical protein AAG906_018833 [Vitis piasezkii]